MIFSFNLIYFKVTQITLYCVAGPLEGRTTTAVNVVDENGTITIINDESS